MNIDILKEIGLTEYESEIYLALLQHGQISAYELAEKTGLYRQATYDALNRLIEKGYVSSVKQGKSQLYKAINPELILEYLNEKSENYKQILPQLIELDKKSKQPLIVETYKGKNVIRIALRDVINQLKDKKERMILTTAVDENFPLKKYQTILDQFERDLIHYNIKEKVIMKKGLKKIFRKGTSKYKSIPEKFFNENSTQIYGDNIQIILIGNPNYLIIIRNKKIVEAYRRQFEFMWSMAK